MLNWVISVYVFLFARPAFEKANKLIIRLGLGGLGVLNHKSTSISGEKWFLENYLKNEKTGVIIDVGANVGNYSIDVLRLSPGLNVYAFEPHPVTFSKLAHNLASFNNAKTINKGLSFEKSSLNLYDYQDKDGSSHASLYEDVITELHGAGVAVAHEVELITLDDFIESKGIDVVKLLKIDTEGNELLVLQGAKKAIESGKIKAIHFEFNEMNVASRTFFRDFWKILESYRFYRLLPSGMIELKAYSPLGCEIFAYQNIVALRKD